MTDQNLLLGAIVVGALLLLAMGSVVSPVVKAYLAAPKRLAEEIRMIMTANPAHRVAVEGSANMKTLAEVLNAFADRYQETFLARLKY